MDNYGFDLDTALTMEDTTITEGVAEIKRSEFETQAKLNDFWITMMPTVVSPTGVCTVCMEALDVYKAGDGGGGGGGDGDGVGGAKRARCGHIFHENCIRRWLSLHSSCPLCRSLVCGDASTVVISSL